MQRAYEELPKAPAQRENRYMPLVERDNRKGHAFQEVGRDILRWRVRELFDRAPAKSMMADDKSHGDRNLAGSGGASSIFRGRRS